ENEGTDSPPNVRSGPSGGNRQQDYRPRGSPAHAQERARQVLRRRHYQEKKTPGKTEGRQKAHEAPGQGRDTPGSISRHPQGGTVATDCTIRVVRVIWARAAGTQLKLKRRRTAADQKCVPQESTR